MLPALAAGAGIAVVGGIINAIGAAKANKASRAEIRRLEELFASIVPPEYDVSPNDPPSEVMRKLQGANLDFSKASGEQLSALGYYAPDVAAYVQEQNPTLVQQTAAGATGREAQLQALREYRNIASGNDPAFQARMQEASRQAQADAQSRMESVLADSQRRGTFGSGLSFQAMLQGNASSMDQAAAAQRAAAIESADRRMSAISGAANIGAGIEGRELDQASQNASIINQFNERTSRNYQQYLNNAADLKNQAQLTNIQMRDKASADAANWAASEKARQNDLLTTGFNNNLQRANGMAGVGAQNISAIQQSAQDRANIVQGVTNIGTGIASAYGQQQYEDKVRKEDRAWAEEMAKKYPTASWDKYSTYRSRP